MLLLVNLIKLQHFCEIHDFLRFWGPEAQNTHKTYRFVIILMPTNAKRGFYLNLAKYHLFREIPPKLQNSSIYAK